MNLGYTNNIPDTPNDPSNDQPNMKTNTNSIQSIIQIDHAGFNDNNGGYHTVIHQVKQVSDPANIANFNEVYAKDYTPDTTGGVADTQLFIQSGLGAISQLTGYLTTDTVTSDGWQWVGGVLIQWGFVEDLTSGATVSVTFKDRVPGAIPFPNNCFFVAATLSSGAGVTLLQIRTSGIVVIGSTVSTTGFDCSFSSTGSVTGRGFYWIAIGN